jgi:hypothetical protein
VASRAGKPRAKIILSAIAFSPSRPKLRALFRLLCASLANAVVLVEIGRDREPTLCSDHRRAVEFRSRAAPRAADLERETPRSGAACEINQTVDAFVPRERIFVDLLANDPAAVQGLGKIH